MGLPDFHSIQSQYVSYHSDYATFIISTVGENDIFNYDGYGELIYLQCHIINVTANLADNDALRLYIDTIIVSDDLIHDMKFFSYNYDTSFIYPISIRKTLSLDIACRKGIQFNSNIRLVYNKNNIGNILITRRFTIGLY